MKKNIILVNSVFNLILAIQIRRTLFADEYFDIVLSDLSKGLDEYAKSEALKEIFNNVYYAKTNSLKGSRGKMARWQGLLNPTATLNFMTEAKIKCDYSDIFCWNPDSVFYYLFMAEKDVDFKLHLYTDSAAGYMTEEPIEYGEDKANIFDYYRFGFTHNFIRRKYGVKPIAKMDYDFYIIRPELGANSGKRKYIEVPEIVCNEETKKLYNSIFFGELNQVEGFEYIIFAQPILDYIKDVSAYEKIMETILQAVPKDKIVVKMHPRCTETDVKIYEKYGVKMASGSYPWEIYCMNHDTSNLKYITICSAAGIMPHILFGINNKCIMLYDLLSIGHIGLIQGFFDKFEDYLYIPKNLESLKEMLERE